MWDYFPQGSTPTYGIIMGGTSDRFSGTNGVSIPACVARIYAMRHGYAFKLVKNLEYISNRTYGNCTSRHMSPWNKIPLMAQYLPTVEILVWIDLDAIIQRHELPLSKVLPNQPLESACNYFPHIKELGSGFIADDPNFFPGAANRTFFWATLDINPTYAVNVNTAVMALRRGERAIEFLRYVWEAGKDPQTFKKHDPKWQSKQECVGYWGWPWEQGGVWDVLLDTSRPEFLRESCILPHNGGHALNSVNDFWGDTHIHSGRPFILHGTKTPYIVWLKVLLKLGKVSLQSVQEVCGIDNLSTEILLSSME